MYHSALPLSPQTSTIHQLYKQYASPFFRVVQGVPISWDPAVATAHLDKFIGVVVWSPCNKFVAVTNTEFVEVLDSVTLSRLSVFYHSSASLAGQQLGFSPDSRCLTLFNHFGIISWDLQTGSPLGTIPAGTTLEEESIATPLSFTYSKDGKIVAVAWKVVTGEGNHTRHDILISTYDLLLGIHAGLCFVPQQQIVYPIWTHNNDIQFATIELGSIRIWQCAFTLTHLPVEVGSFSVPDEIASGDYFLFLPTLSRLATIHGDIIQVWDAKASKLLLKLDLTPTGLTPTSQATPVFKLTYPFRGSFSSDGCFLACANTAGEVYVWRESPTGYVLHKQPPSTSISFPCPTLSPNGESIIIPLDSKILQWNTRDQIPPLSNISTNQHNFILGLSPDEKLAALAQQKENIVTILDLQSGEPRWIIDMGVEIDCLCIAGGTITIVGEEKFFTWNLSSGSHAINTGINNSIHTTILPCPLVSPHQGLPSYISASPGSSYIVIARDHLKDKRGCLGVYSVSDGRCLAWIPTTLILRPQFTQDGHEVWSEHKIPFWEQCEVVKDGESGAIQLKVQDGTQSMDTSRIVLQESLHGYKVTDGGWVLSPTQKHLLWLPHHWRSDNRCRTWSGQFLGLLHSELPEVVILEFFE